MIHPHISQNTEGFIPRAVEASYIIFIDLQGNNTSKLQHNRGGRKKETAFLKREEK